MGSMWIEYEFAQFCGVDATVQEKKREDVLTRHNMQEKQTVKWRIVVDLINI